MDIAAIAKKVTNIGFALAGTAKTAGTILTAGTLVYNPVTDTNDATGAQSIPVLGIMKKREIEVAGGAKMRKDVFIVNVADLNGATVREEDFVMIEGEKRGIFDIEKPPGNAIILITLK